MKKKLSMTQYDWLSQDINRIPFSTDVLWRKTTLKKEFDKQKCSSLKIKTRKTIWTKDIELTKKIQQRQIITFNTWFSSTSHLTRTSARFNFNGTSLFFYIFHRIFQSRWKIYRNGRDHSDHNSALSEIVSKNSNNH